MFQKSISKILIIFEFFASFKKSKIFKKKYFQKNQYFQKFQKFPLYTDLNYFKITSSTTLCRFTWVAEGICKTSVLLVFVASGHFFLGESQF